MVSQQPDRKQLRPSDKRAVERIVARAASEERGKPKAGGQRIAFFEATQWQAKPFCTRA